VTILQFKHYSSMFKMLTRNRYMPSIMAYGKVSLSFAHIDGMLT
jgi:hypothetical protein